MWRRRGMKCSVVALLLLTCFLFSASAYPLCASTLEAPGPSKVNLTFCTAPEYKANGCCNTQTDNQLKSNFTSMNISNANCAAVVKQILCSQCDAYSADLYNDATEQSVQRSVPYLCNNNGTGSYCDQVWSACSNVAITNSPFQPGLGGGTTNSSTKASATLNSYYSSQADFCGGLAQPASAGNFCFSGTPFKLPAAQTYTPMNGLCLEKVANTTEGPFLNLVPHPDGSNRVFLTTQAGLVYLANVSNPNSGQNFTIDFTAPFLNISDRVTNNGELGLLGLALHPDYVNNGRLFVSYDCDSKTVPNCAGVCGCQKANGCNITVIGSGACQYTAIVAEYTVNASGSTPVTALSANPVEVRRIFSFGLPYSNHHAGGLWFGPVDKYLYYPLGDGGGAGDIWNNAQNKNLPLGKMMRLDIDNIPSSQQITALGLYGNYSIPATNPFAGVNNTRGEIYAYGLRNPWRCSFDKLRPWYFYCADVGQALVEEVDLISKGGNYGWRVYEGTELYNATSTPGGSTNPNSINAIMPILEYTHAMVPFKGSASVTGGYVSRSIQDACAYGKYIYADFFGVMWAAQENPALSGVYNHTNLPWSCSSGSPMSCDVNNGTVNLDLIYSYGEDTNGDIYVLGGNGAYRMVSPSLCNITCNAASLIPAPTPAPAPSPAGHSDSATLFVNFRNTALCLALTFVLLFGCESCIHLFRV